MPIINISNEAEQAIRAKATNSFRQTGKQLPNGTWDIPLEDETLDRLNSVRFKDETISDCIIRACTCLGSVGFN